MTTVSIDVFGLLNVGPLNVPAAARSTRELTGCRDERANPSATPPQLCQSEPSRAGRTSSNSSSAVSPVVHCAPP